MPGSTFKVITTGIALESGVATLDSQFAERTRMGATADERPDPELQRQPLRRRPRHGVRPQLQHPVRAALDVPRARGDGRRNRSMGDRRATADRPATTGGEHVRQHRQPRAGAAAAGDPRFRPERGADGAAAHGDGGGDRRQRRPDDDAVRRRVDLRPGRTRARPDEPVGVEDTDLPADRRDRTSIDDRRRRARDGELLHRA